MDSAAQAGHLEVEERGRQVPGPPDIIGLLRGPGCTLVELRLCARPLLLRHPSCRRQSSGQLLLSPCFHLIGLHLQSLCSDHCDANYEC
jgi:hypothetical protein